MLIRFTIINEKEMKPSRRLYSSSVLHFIQSDIKTSRFIFSRNDNGLCRVGFSCRVDKKSYDKQVALGQPVYQTGQKIINSISPFIYKCVDPFTTIVTRFNKHVMSDYA